MKLCTMFVPIKTRFCSHLPPLGGYVRFAEGSLSKRGARKKAGTHSLKSAVTATTEG